ncbi:MAG TPA: hypothetical protein VFZ25_18085 [Chloroflexota bacterium]|nr:hypothetical protein [Chloroflexota bacterium]
MAILIPLWVGVGRGIVGVLSIGALYTAILAAPLLFVMQLVITLIVRANPTARIESALSPRLTSAITIYYITALVFGFTFVDFATNGSVLLTLTGDDYAIPIGSQDYYMSDVSWLLSLVSALIALMALLVSLALAIRDLQAARRHNG